MKKVLFLLMIPVLTLAQQTYVPDDNFEAYLEANGMGNGIANDDSVTTANISGVNSLAVSSQNILDLTGIEDFISLTYLNCPSNQLTLLDLSQNTALTYLGCSYNQLSTLDVSQNTALTSLYCAYNQLSTLDVSQNTALTYFSCSSNQLTSLDFRNGNNQNLLSFDVTSNPILTCINVDDVNYSNNNWFSIDAQHYFSTNCPPPLPRTYVPDDNFEAYLEANGMGNGIANDDSVTTANISGVNSLAVSSQNILDLTGIEDFISLTGLYCSSNQLTTLDLSQNTALTDLNCRVNQLTSLDLSQNTTLTGLVCSSNQLTTLDLSQNTALTGLICNFNQLTSLDLSQNTALTNFGCNSNQLTSLDFRNGNNQNLLSFNVTSNPILTCINVDDVNYSNNNWVLIDAQHYFSTNCSAPNSVQEISHSISLYPNPTSENITISIENFNGNIQTEVYDLIGNKLQTTSETTISLQEYAIGIYILKVAYGDRVEKLKVIKD
ncbi:T9SS type A sorting domain-containing protein [bacterium]|nr:T9SS type A sorting domain-containing protein [bacterium]